jgi:hypothetical protein
MVCLDHVGHDVGDNYRVLCEFTAPAEGKPLTKFAGEITSDTTSLTLNARKQSNVR